MEEIDKQINPELSVLKNPYAVNVSNIKSNQKLYVFRDNAFHAFKVDFEWPKSDNLTIKANNKIYYNVTITELYSSVPSNWKGKINEI